MSTACLTAADSGYFVFEQTVDVNRFPQNTDLPREIAVDYHVR